ncbi:MAG: hypothetical protein N838_09835 [Thiohalocapsa sp. PB-PSB1]|nr:MAG: hypothetical protein N838_09835 [Thiohalocapsa sp. PB-PSB1]
MKYRMIPRLSSMLAVWSTLIGWNYSAPHIGVLGNLAFLLVIAVPLVMSGSEVVFYRRYAYRHECLIQPSWLYRLMGLEPLILGGEIVKALLLGMVLMVGTAALTLREAALLLLNVVIMALLMPRVPGLLHGSVNRTYLYAMSRLWAIRFSTWLLWLDSLLVLALSINDDYRGLSWADAVVYSTALPHSPNDNVLVSLLVRIDAGPMDLRVGPATSYCMRQPVCRRPWQP